MVARLCPYLMGTDPRSTWHAHELLFAPGRDGRPGSFQPLTLHSPPSFP